MAPMALSDSENEVIFGDKIVVLKRDVSFKDSDISWLKSELEKVNLEKESYQLKIEYFENASKSLDQLLGSQIIDKSRKGVGFVSYNVVPPPHTGFFSPLKIDLSNFGIEEFQEPEFGGYGPKTSKSASKDISNEVRKSNDAPLVEKLVSDDKLEKKIVFPTIAKIEFVNAVKASACWVWRPIKPNSASITLKRYDYVDGNPETELEDSIGLNSLEYKKVETPRYLSLVVPLKKVGDEAVHKELGDIMERAATTASSLEAEFEITSKQSNDPPLSRGYTLESGEDSMKLLELMEFYTQLSYKNKKSVLATTKVQIVNGVRQLQALVDKKRFIVTESSIRRDLHLDDAEAFEEVGEDSDHPTDSTQVPILDQPSTSSKTKKKQSSTKNQRQEEEVSQDETEHEESVLDLEKAKDAQAKEIAALKKRIQRLERKKMSRPTGLKRLKKVGLSRRVESSEDKESLVAPEDASKQGRSITDIDDDVECTKLDDSTTGEAITTASVKDSAAPTTIEEITLAQTLIQIKAAKPKVVTTAARTTTTTRPKAKRVVVQEPSEFRVPQEEQPLISKDKGKGITIPPEVPLKIKDQIALDEQIARDIQAKLDAELIEEQNLQGYKKKKPT
ncbi:hypothetical protein Tco_1010276 [Tanacetum coccineum]